MSPGSVTEKLYFFLAEYDSGSRVAAGGGNFVEGEDIEVLELSIEDAMTAIERGDIADGKTIMLLQYAFIHVFSEAGGRFRRFAEGCDRFRCGGLQFRARCR